MSGISKVFAGEIVEEGKQQIKEHQHYFFPPLKTNIILVVIKLNTLCSSSIGCLREVGRHTTTAAQAHEGGSEEAEEQRADSKQQTQADPFSLRILRRRRVAGLKRCGHNPGKHLFYQLRRMAILLHFSMEIFDASFSSNGVKPYFPFFVCEFSKWDLRCFNSFLFLVHFSVGKKKNIHNKRSS